MGDNPDDLLTPSVVARLMNCSVDLVRKYADTGELPALVTTSGRRLFRRHDVDELIARRALLPRRRNGALLSPNQRPHRAA